MAEKPQKQVFFPEIPGKETLLNEEDPRIDGQDILPGSIGYSNLGSLIGENTRIGEEALLDIVVNISGDTGVRNSAFGFQAATNITTGINNVAVGRKAATTLTTGTDNIAIGSSALTTAVGANNNIAIGTSALEAATSGSVNIAIGTNAMAALTTGGSNIAIGAGALALYTSGDTNNLVIGHEAYSQNITGNNNTILGMYAGSSSTAGDNNVFIGYNAGYFETGNNLLYIANSDTSTPLIYGLFTGTGAGLTIYSQATDGTPLNVQGIASQSSNLQQWQSSTPTTLASVSATGVITAPNFVSSVATGTQPYATSSTTLNTNLNADLLDSQTGSYYLDRANHTGTQTMSTISDLPTLAAGTYTPTRSAEANMDANVTTLQAQYLRVGATVTVSGRFTADPTLTATATSFEITLPVASNIGAVEDVAGVAFCGSIAGMGAEIIGVIANDTAKIQWVSSDITSQTWSYVFSYQII